MIDLLSTKIACGDLYINRAAQLVANHEWGRARIAIEKGIAKGRLSEPDRAYQLLRDICDCLGIKPEVEAQ